MKGDFTFERKISWKVKNTLQVSEASGECHELKPSEPSEPIESETDESSNNSKKEAVSVTKIEKAEFEEEPSNPKLIKEPKVSEPRKESNDDEPIVPSIDLELTNPSPTSSNTVKKSELSTMMDMMKFMHNQQ
ncbi:hypothetical protein PVK06_040077 [Gossypium arboreum]|uniref:Uncharacterized protein n=1 Tax=Gossypium arboreum TaxID=29729 RepID=A0ABR0N4J5_GOSAR|nr:hypothetical protein PVK06_040077 [Gossypium arboreum]